MTAELAGVVSERRRMSLNSRVRAPLSQSRERGASKRRNLEIQNLGLFTFFPSEIGGYLSERYSVPLLLTVALTAVTFHCSSEIRRVPWWPKYLIGP